MSAKLELKITPTDWTASRVVYELHSIGWSLRQLAFKHGYKSSALSAVVHRRWPKGERLIADALGIRADAIWPSRYKNGQPIGRRILNGEAA